MINKVDLLTNTTVVDDAMRFVSQRSKEKIKLLNSINEDEKNSTSLIILKTRISYKKRKLEK